MKKVLTTLLWGVLAIGTASAQNTFFDKADQFFMENVKNGLVDYEKIKKNPSTLNSIIKDIELQAKLDASTDEQKALLINAYNLFVIKGIVDAYPTASPQQITSFFDNKNFTIEGKKVSLNQLEKEVLIKQTKDARLHFALVCAAKGCPKIIPEAYRPSSLDAQLDRQTRLALNDASFTQVNYQGKTVKLSKIFEWYRKDFTTQSGDLLTFINQYRDRSIGSEFAIFYYKYNWELNGIKPVSKPTSKSNSSNLLQFTPSQLFGKGQYEVNFFNNLYSQTSVRDDQGNNLEQDRRVSILTSTLQFTYGVSEKAKVNLGVDVILAGGSIGFTPGNQFQLFGSNIASDLAVAAVGPRIKFQPIPKYKFYSVQSTFLFPVARDLEGQTNERDVFLALNRYQWRTQFFYDFKLTEKLRLFYDFTINYLIRRNRDEVFFGPNFVDLPSTVFLNYFPTQKWNFFVNGQYVSRYGNTRLEDVESNLEKKFGLLQWIIQVGGGVKYQATPQLGFEVSYGNFVAGRGFQGIEAGAGAVVNFGIRFIR